MTVDLSTNYLGLQLANPIVPSASPLTGNIDTLLELAEAGASAVVLPSLFEEQIVHDALAVADLADFGADLSPEFFGGQLPEMDSYNTGSEAYLRTLVRAKEELSIPVIGSLNGDSPGGWVSYGRKIEEAGADALELNIYIVAADMDRTGAEVVDDYLRLVEQMRGTISIPLAVKVGPFFSSMANMARRLVDAGADGLVLFNRFYQPDIDLDALDVTPNLVLSTPFAMRLPLTWIGILYGRLDVSLAATSGVHSAEDVVKLVLAGADVTMSASALLRHGPAHLGVMLQGLEDWLTERDYVSVEQAKGSLSQQSSPDPTAFERANYMRSLVTYASSRS
ncbi:MAG TPA: dihydroorotate dehydrogenase-like protein [Acidimicrobiia bacterium]|jgi:dihydroorotate dehydrogenase (fumarate)|nr:dihydroorotate dehydrogenase-like protein [Acidimicrobiia bacterium]